MLEEINHAGRSLVQLRFPAKVSQATAGTRELVVGSRTPYILVFAEANIRNLPYKYCVVHNARKFYNSEPRLQHPFTGLCRYGLLTMNANGMKI